MQASDGQAVSGRIRWSFHFKWRQADGGNQSLAGGGLADQFAAMGFCD
jgi:hypothetical protein